MDSELVAEAQASSLDRARGPAKDFAGAALLGMSLQELEELVLSCDQPKYRGKQIRDKLLHGVKAVADLDQVCRQQSITGVECSLVSAL